MDNEPPIIQITQDDLEKVQTQQEITINSEELLNNHGQVRLNEKVFSEICNRTVQHNNENSGEFWLFLIGKNDVADETVEVGIGYHSGVSANTNEVVEKLRPFTENGYKVIADYHNHPKQSVLDYEALNLSDEDAISPSISDIESDIYPTVKEKLGQVDYPRIIGTVSEKKGVIMGGFQILRQPNYEEEKQIEIEEPIYIVEEPDENGITLKPSLYTDPRKMVQLGIIKPVDVLIPVVNSSDITMPSPF